MENDKEMNLRNIADELKNFGATYEIDESGNILAVLPKNTTIASMPFKDRKERRTNIEMSNQKYFQNGIHILHPGRHGYKIDAIAGYQIILAPIKNPKLK